MNINEIKELLKVIDSTNLEYVKLETDDLKLEVSKTSESIRCISTTKAETSTIEDAQVIEASNESSEVLCTVVAPLMGTFYDSPNPEAERFVKVGDIVNEGDTLCILEAMKLMNEITSEIKGEIVEILTKNEELVEYNQPLFKIKPM